MVGSPRFASLAPFLGMLAVAGGAGGAEPGPPPAAAPAGPSSSEPGRHDGFFFRAGLGGGYGRSAYRVRLLLAERDGFIEGGGGVFEALAGTTLKERWVVGGGLLSLSLLEPRHEFGGVALDTSNTRYTLGVAAVFGAYYFDPVDGLHLQALLGAASGEVRQEGEAGDADSFHPVGAALGLGIGWETFVAEEWSLGFVARVFHARLGGHYVLGDIRHEITFPHLLVAATYH